MKLKSCCAVLMMSTLLLTCASALAQDQTVPGAGNQNAVNLSSQSPLVQSAYRFLIRQAGQLRDSKLRNETLDAITNPNTCVQHRAGVNDATKNAILQALITAG